MLHGIKLLAADDDQMSLDILTTVLSSKGVTCTTAANGREVMDLLENDPGFDMVLLDLQMPVMDGFEVLSQCKGNPYLKEIPIIVLAANYQDKLKSLKLGADDFLSKPYVLDELKLRISRLVQSRRLARTSKQAKDEFLAIASHELRTPMNQITMISGLIDDENLSDKQREYLDLLNNSVVNLTGIIKEIISYVRIDNGVESALAVPFSLRSTINDILDAHRKNAEQRGIDLKLIIADDISDNLNGPLCYINRLFTILVENAVKFSTRGEICISVMEESHGKHDSKFFCSISDQGIGIPEEMLDKIFEPFVQVDSSTTRQYEGIGLGLAIAKRMVEFMGGSIGVESHADSGSTFKFSFYCDIKQD